MRGIKSASVTQQAAQHVCDPTHFADLRIGGDESLHCRAYKTLPGLADIVEGTTKVAAQRVGCRFAHVLNRVERSTH